MFEIVPTLFSIFMHTLRFFVSPIYALIYFKKPQEITPVTNPLLKVSATTLARKIRSGELSSETIVEAYIKRIKEVNPLINAVIQDRFEEALKEAKLYDEKLKNGEVDPFTLEKVKPLYGIPITIKESVSLEGMKYTGGAIARKDCIAERDGEAVKLLKNAGGIPLLVSNTSEFCVSLNSFNYVHGQTGNPYDIRKTSGGSSGGEASLIAAGASVLGLGSDFLGSIRIPSFFSGIFGHKPTSGIIPNEGHLPVLDDEMGRKFLTIGPLARYAEDLELGLRVLTSNCEKPLPLDEPVNLKDLRVFYVDNFNSVFGVSSTTSEIREIIQKAVYHCSKNGACIQKFPYDWISNVINVQMAVYNEIKYPEFLVDLKNPEKKRRPILEFVKSVFRLSQYTPILTQMRLIIEFRGGVTHSRRKTYKNDLKELHKKINELLKDNGVFIYPTFPHAAHYPELMYFEVDNSVYCSLANMLELPSTQVPMGLNKDGLPIGFQVMSAMYQDHICLAVAKEFEKAFGGWVPPS